MTKKWQTDFRPNSEDGARGQSRPYPAALLSAGSDSIAAAKEEEDDEDESGSDAVDRHLELHDLCLDE